MSVVLVIFLLFLQLRISFQFYKKELKTHGKEEIREGGGTYSLFPQ